MLLTRLYLRNFRVYEDELELALPPGLVGVYGPNGAGKSTLLEAILFTLWGRARTPKEEIRSAGVRADCVTELEFEHEGHLYLARRTLSGINSSVRAQAHCDGLIMSEGVRDTARYLHSVLGMDDAAFRASVFAEQKQLAAFSSQSPADRRRLVLQLLGITPLDAARDMARKDARERASEHERLRAMLPDVAAREVAAADADVAARAAEALSAREEQAAEAARALVDRTAATLADLDCLRQRHEALMIEGRATRGELELAQAEVGSLSEELEALRGAAAELEHLEPLAALAGVTEARLLALSNALDAARAAASISMPDPPEPFDEVAHECAVDAAEAARTALASLQGRHQAALAELERARRQAESSRSLSGEGACPLCGQALGTAFEEVRRHRAEEVAEAERRLGALATEEKRAAAAAEAALSMLRRSEEARRRAQAAQQGWEQAVTRRGEAEAALVKAWASPETGGPAPAATPSAVAELERLVEATRLDMASQRAAAASAQTLRGRLERRGAVEESLAAALRRTEAAEVRRRELLDQLAALAYDASALEAARQAHAHASAAAEEAAASARQALLAATRARTAADAEARALADARGQHAKLAELQAEAQHLSRVAELLSDFRNTVVASVGPRLALQAAELFAELTDHEYDELQVDPETYELQISDAGTTYGLDRFSGSEIDLANLALRVAISEHVRFQSGGTVGLLVLDEVFGPLDEDRKSRMLLALERLRGRFRQVLVVTHDASIKEQLPNAIEVVKQPGRRATARVLN